MLRRTTLNIHKCSYSSRKLYHFIIEKYSEHVIYMKKLSIFHFFCKFLIKIDTLKYYHSILQQDRPFLKYNPFAMFFASRQSKLWTEHVARTLCCKTEVIFRFPKASPVCKLFIPSWNSSQICINMRFLVHRITLKAQIWKRGMKTFYTIYFYTI